MVSRGAGAREEYLKAIIIMNVFSFFPELDVFPRLLLPAGGALGAWEGLRRRRCSMEPNFLGEPRNCVLVAKRLARWRYGGLVDFLRRFVTTVIIYVSWLLRSPRPGSFSSGFSTLPPPLGPSLCDPPPPSVALPQVPVVQEVIVTQKRHEQGEKLRGKKITDAPSRFKRRRRRKGPGRSWGENFYSTLLG